MPQKCWYYQLLYKYFESIPWGGHPQNVPLHWLVKLLQVDSKLHYVGRLEIYMYTKVSRPCRDFYDIFMNWIDWFFLAILLFLSIVQKFGLRSHVKVLVSPWHGCQFSAVSSHLDLFPLHPDVWGPPLNCCQYRQHCHQHHYCYLEAIIGPASELHDAGLLVEGEILNVHLTGGVVDGWRLPLQIIIMVMDTLQQYWLLVVFLCCMFFIFVFYLNQSSMVEGCLRCKRNFKIAIGAGKHWLMSIIL